jgi:predicted nucleic acid-binding protein
MMADLVIADSDVLIDTGRGASEAVACLQQIERQAQLAISVVTQMELIVFRAVSISAAAICKFRAI